MSPQTPWKYRITEQDGSQFTLEIPTRVWDCLSQLREYFGGGDFSRDFIARVEELSLNGEWIDSRLLPTSQEEADSLPTDEEYGRVDIQVGQYAMSASVPQLKSQQEEVEMKTKIKLHETLYQSGCPGCYPGVTSATPVAWICEDTYAVVLRQDGGYALEDMSSKELSAFKNCEQAMKENEKKKELSELIDEILYVHPERLAKLLLEMPEELQKIRPLLDSARKSFGEIDLGDELPLCDFLLDPVD